MPEPPETSSTQILLMGGIWNIAVIFKKGGQNLFKSWKQDCSDKSHPSFPLMPSEKTFFSELNLHNDQSTAFKPFNRALSLHDVTVHLAMSSSIVIHISSLCVFSVCTTRL